MTAILRWFHADGVRHRAYIRRGDNATPELVVASREWQASKAAPYCCLEDYTEEELIRIARTLRTAAMMHASSVSLEAAAG